MEYFIFNMRDEVSPCTAREYCTNENRGMLSCISMYGSRTPTSSSQSTTRAEASSTSTLHKRRPDCEDARLLLLKRPEFSLMAQLAR